MHGVRRQQPGVSRRLSLRFLRLLRTALSTLGGVAPHDLLVRIAD